MATGSSLISRGVAANATPDATRFERQLDQALSQSRTPGAANLARFWTAWEADGGELIPDLAAFRCQCEAPDGPINVLDRCHGVLTGASGSATASKLDGHGKQLVKALVLAAVERYMMGLSGLGTMGSPGALTVYAAHPLTAYLLAAVHQGCGLRLVAHAQTNAPDPINVLTDAPAHVYSEGDGDSALDAWGAELLAWCDAVRGAPEKWLDKSALRQGARAATLPVSAGFVRLALARVEREFQVRPLIAITAGAQSSLAIDPSLLGRLDQAFGGVSGFVHAPGAAVTVVPELAKLQGDVQRYVAEVFAALDPAPSAARPTAQRRSVFISYAHNDGADCRKQLETHLRGVPSSPEIDFWSDARLETGDLWRTEIGAAMSRATCAVLVLTPAFMESKFITDHELPTLLRRRQSEGLKLLPILALDCVFPLHPWLDELQVQCKDAPLRRLLAEGAGADHTEMKNLAIQIVKFLDQSSPDQST